MTTEKNMVVRGRSSFLPMFCAGLSSVCTLAATGGATAGATAKAVGLQAPVLPSNHALIITVSEYARSPLPGVLTDRKLAMDLAARFAVPKSNIVELSEQQVTREGLKQALATLNDRIMPGDKLYVYFSGHGARFYTRATNQCTESIVMQDMHVVTNAEFASMLKPLTAKTDKTLVMLDSCHSGGVAQAAGSRALVSAMGLQRPKFSAEASSPQCSLAVNLGSFSQARGIDLNTTDHNLVILAAARNNEVAWDTSKGGALTYNFQQCLSGGAADTDRSGSLSMQELTDCVQARLDQTQELSARQHATLVGNSALVPTFAVVGSTAPTPTPTLAAAPTANSPGPGAAPSAPIATPPLPPPVDIFATMHDIFSQRDDRWEVRASLDRTTLKIGSDLNLSVASKRDGFVYLFYQGSQAENFYLLFPNQIDTSNAIGAGEELRLPRESWRVTALGPRGTDHLLLLVTATPRDFSSVALPAEYVSQSGPFQKIQRSPQAVAHISQIATVSAQAHTPICQATDGSRDLGVARQCSSVFGASLINVEETE